MKSLSRSGPDTFRTSDAWGLRATNVQCAVKIGTRSLGQCPKMTYIGVTRMIARLAPPPSSPAPSPRRYAAMLTYDARAKRGYALVGQCPACEIDEGHRRPDTWARSCAR